MRHFVLVEPMAKSVSAIAIVAMIVRVVKRVQIAPALVDGLDPSVTYHASRANMVLGVKKNVRIDNLMVSNLMFCADRYSLYFAVLRT